MGISTHPHSPEYFYNIIYYPKTGLPRFFPDFFHYLCTSNKKKMEIEAKGQCPCCGSDDVQPCDDGTFICMHCGETLSK